MRGGPQEGMKSYKKIGGWRMFEDHGGENKTRAEAQKDRIVYFGVITEVLEERATPRLPPSFPHSPPWIQLHLHPSHLFIISPFLSRAAAASSPSLSHCFITSFLRHLSPALFFNTPLHFSTLFPLILSISRRPRLALLLQNDGMLFVWLWEGGMQRTNSLLVSRVIL